MSSRPKITKAVVINAGDMSGKITSAVTLLQDLSLVGYGMSWSGISPVGSISVQVSNDYAIDGSGQVYNPGTWTTIVLNYNGGTVNSIPLTGNTGTGFINVAEIAAYAIRMVYTATSGTGTLNSNLTAKVM
jgi:hypothetical protein